jgi:carboxypeptidase PM20D1
MFRTTTAATIFHAGVKDNVLPSLAAATVNFRIFPGDTIASVVEHVREVVDDARIRITPTAAKQREASNVSNVGGAGWSLLVSTLRSVYPDAVPTPFLIPGGTDARYYRELTDSAFGFMPARLPPGDFRRAHGLDERLSVASYLEGIRFYAQLLHTAGTWH